MRIFSTLRYSEWSLRRKLFGYMFVLAALLLLALVSGLLLFGRLDTVGKNAYASLDIQAESFEKDVFKHFQRLAAAGIELSEDTTALLERHLAWQGLSFYELNSAKTEIAALQEALLEPLRQRLLQENCSGVFVMLDVTVNTAVANAAVSRTGLYLQQSGYKTSDKSILLYRGLAEVGKSHGMIPHRKWRLEFRTDLFPNYSELLSCAGLPLEEAYLLTGRFMLPGTSEAAVLVVVPMIGGDGTLYGFCGYEVSASYFKTYHAQPTTVRHLTCLLAEGGLSSVDASRGLSCGVSGGYYLEPRGALSLEEAGDGLLRFSGAESSYIGVAREVSLSPNNKPYTIAAMMPKGDYDRAVMKTAMQNTVFWVLIAFFAVSCCLFFSKRYLAPILHGLEQIKSDRRFEAESSVPEINDLFAFLAEQDRLHGDSLAALEREKLTALGEKERLELQYKQARLVFAQARAEYDKAQRELADVRKELDRLAYSRKSEIDPDDYQHFLNGINSLTQRERDVFEWYLAGKTAKEILELTGIKEGTLKTHNHNILDKLGVSSRKQMLRYAALMNRQGQGAECP